MAKLFDKLTIQIEYPTGSGSWYDIVPTNQDIVLSKKRNDNQYFYRLELETELLLRKADWALISDIEENNHCSEIDLRISCGGEIIYEGLLRLNDGDFDFSHCEATIKSSTNDAYTCLERGLKQEVNILSGVSEVTLNFAIGELETQRCPPFGTTPVVGMVPAGGPYGDDSCLSELDGWTILENNYTNISPNGTLALPPFTADQYTVWIRQTVDSATTPPGIGWINTTGTTWVREPIMIFDEDNSTDPPPPASSWVQFWNPAYADNEPLDNGVRLEDVLQLFLNAIDCPLTIVSDFFSINPDGTHPINDVYTAAIAKLNNVLIFQISDVKRGNVSNNATICNMTLQELFDFFAILNVYPSIQSGVLRLEHITFYENKPISLNLNLPQYRRWVKRSRKYTYLNDKNPKFEKFAWGVNTNNGQFNGLPIEYAGNCYSKDNDTIQHNAGRFVTDIQTVINSPQLFPDDGFVVVNAIEFDGQLYADTEYFAPFASTEALNAHLSFRNIHNVYWRNYAYQRTGYINGDLVTFDSVRPNKKGEAITLSGWCCSDFFDFDPATLVSTPLGDGEVEKITFSAKTGIATFELIYGGGSTTS